MISASMASRSSFNEADESLGLGCLNSSRPKSSEYCSSVMKHLDSMIGVEISLKNDGFLEAPPVRCPDTYRDGQVGRHSDDEARKGLTKSYFTIQRGSSAPTIAIAMYEMDPQFDILPLTAF